MVNIEPGSPILANVLSNTSGKLVTAQELIDNKLFVYYRID